MMVKAIDRDEVCRLLERGAQLVEVLPSKEYRDQHLPGAIHVPLDTLDREAPARLRRDRPIIVYCYDTQ